MSEAAGILPVVDYLTIPVKIVKLPPRDASLYKKMRNLPKKENGVQSSNFPSHPPRSRIDESITGLEENSQSVNHGDGQNIFCYVPMQEMLNMLISLQFMYLISHLLLRTTIGRITISVDATLSK